jgi:hypothetical protein
MRFFSLFLFAIILSTNAIAQSDAISISGDLRYRHETRIEEGKEDRYLQRIRARLGFRANPTEQIEIRVGFATVEDGNPVSANITLSEGGSKKSFALDYAYFNYSISDQLQLMGGKLRNPWYRAGGQPIIFDSDLTPEGLALRYDMDNIFINIVNFQSEEVKASDLDPQMIGGQIGVNLDNLVIGLGYQDYLDTQGSVPFYDGKNRRASIDADGGYLYDYNIGEAFFQYTNDDLLDERLRVFGLMTQNFEAEEGANGFTLGLQYGNASGPGTWRVGYAYSDLERNTVLSLYTDSDIGGGGTGKKGHAIDFIYVLNSGLRYQLTYFDNQILNSSDEYISYNRLHLDAQFSF